MHAWLRVLVFVWCSIPVLGVCAGSSAVIVEQEISNAARGDQLLLLSGRLERSLAASIPDVQTSDFSDAADLFGKLVARGQDIKGDAGFFLSLRQTSETLYDRCRHFIRATEGNANENETALEQLYRSEIWYDLNYALAAFRYWQAWIDLSVARLQLDTGERAASLNRAESGFRSASVRILYPGIVYGSWMGMGYVSLARGDPMQAKQRFEVLLDALKNYPDYAFRETVEMELALFDPKKILATPIRVDEQITSSAQARLMVEQAFALLEQHRREKGGAIQAAQLLKPLLNSAWLSDALVNRLMQYVNEIVGQDVGILGLLVDAQYAYQNKQYHTAVLKYREFMRGIGSQLPLDLARFQYQLAAALQLTGLSQQAFRELEKVDQSRALPESLGNALAKLRFVISESIYAQHNSEHNKSRLIATAEEYLRTNPQDKDKAAAHLAMARFGNARQLAMHLKSAAANSEYRPAADQVRLHRSLEKFQESLSMTGAQATVDAATETLNALGSLSRRLRNSTANRCLAVQMETVLMARPAKILQKISKLEGESELGAQCLRIIVWSKLRVLTALNNYSALSAMISNADGDSMRHQEIFVFLRELENKRQTAPLETLSSLFVAALHDTPDMLRQVQLMRIENLQWAGSGDDAFRLAQELVQQFPESGNAWIAYAKTAQLTGQLDNAARGWSQITSAVPQGSPRWIDAMLKRAELAVRGGGASSRACDLLSRIAVYKHLFDGKGGNQFSALVQESRCQNLSG